MTRRTWTARAMQKYADGRTADVTDEKSQNQRISSVTSACSPSAYTANTGTAPSTAPTEPDALLRCLIRGCETPAADIAYCVRHREMADDGTLWLRCVFDQGHAPTATHDPIACAEHRAVLDQVEAQP